MDTNRVALITRAISDSGLDSEDEVALREFSDGFIDGELALNSGSDQNDGQTDAFRAGCVAGWRVNGSFPIGDPDRSRLIQGSYDELMKQGFPGQSPTNYWDGFRFFRRGFHDAEMGFSAASDNSLYLAGFTGGLR